MRAMKILAAINTVIWGGLVFSGVRIIRSVLEQNVEGSPNSGQLTYYLIVPAVMAFVVIGAYLLARFLRLKRLMLLIQVGVLLAFFPYILFYTGGI